MSLSIGIANKQKDIFNEESRYGIPFDFVIKLPPPLRSGIDYGFKPGKNVI